MLKSNSLPNNYTDIKANNIHNMLFLLKLASFLLASIPFFHQYSSHFINEIGNDYRHSFIFTCIALIIIGTIMFLWTSFEKARASKQSMIILEILTLFTLFTCSIYTTNYSGINFKFLFLILIITYTIELGKLAGILLSVISSLLVLIPGLINEQYTVSFDSDLTISLLFFLISWTLGHYVKLEHTHIEYLTNMTNIDSLTKVYNHRYFHECLEKNCTENLNNGQPLSLIMIDVDFFKDYNDLLGHQHGDHLLINLVNILSNNIRQNDLLFRYGGDEFCIILNNTTQQEALLIGEGLRLAINSYPLEGVEHLPGKKLSVSIGVASLSDDVDSYLSLIDKTDTALYRAKYLRKNRVEAYGNVWNNFKELSETNIDDILKYVKTLISIIDAKDKYTYFHIERVAHYCELFADYLQLSDEDRRNLIFGAYLHDLGKINIAKDILITDNPLTELEWNELKSHPTESVAIVEKIDGFDSVIPIVRHHHERYDGSGYPDALSGHDIPTLARILAIVDSYDAMTHKRPYQKKKTSQEGLQELIRCKGTQFDAKYVDLFVKMMNETL